jgi:hypothetical protein
MQGPEFNPLVPQREREEEREGGREREREIFSGKSRRNG